MGRCVSFSSWLTCRECSHHVSLLALQDEDALSHCVDPSSPGPSHHLLVLAPLQEVRGYIRRAQDDSDTNQKHENMRC